MGVSGLITFAQARATVEKYNKQIKKNLDPSWSSQLTTSTDTSFIMVQMVDDYFFTKQHFKPTINIKLKKHGQLQ